jgi:hypothetical protein
LLAEYGEKFSPVTAPPVPVEDIIELHLQLRLELRDLREEFGSPDVHGAIWFKQEKIAVDQILDPHRNPRMLGRYRYTLGHETGHWRLHRTHYLDSEEQRALFETKNEKPAYVCRSTNKPRVEIQADRFSAFLLMPRNLVVAAWEKWRGSMAPIALDDCPDCGYEFPPPERKPHEPTASNAGILSGEATHTEYDVFDVTYAVHTKRDADEDAPKTMRVDYRVGFNLWQSEWVCLEHTGYAHGGI